MPNDKANSIKDTKTPAVELLTKFLKDNDIIIVADKVDNLTKDGNGLLYTMTNQIRVQVFYRDQIEKQEKVEVTN
jgi:sugar lactone lactonase YvrE